MADFKQAIQWLKEGKKVRRINWIYSTYLYLEGEKIKDSLNFKGTRLLDCMENVYEDNWEIYEETKKETLGDYGKCGYGCGRDLIPIACPDGKPGCCVMHYTKCECQKINSVQTIEPIILKKNIE